MGNWGNWCCHGVACIIGQDAFDRTNNDDLGGDWTEVFGNAQISSNTLVADGGGLWLGKFNTVHPLSDESMCVSVDSVSATTAVRVIVNYLDSNNYLYGRFDFTNLKLEIWKRIGGVETMIRQVNAPQLADLPTVGLGVKFSRTQLLASASTVNEECYDCVPYIDGGYYAGIASESGGETFDNFDFRQHNRTWVPSHPGTDCCFSCCYCISGTDAAGFDIWQCIPRTLTLTFSVTGDLVGSPLDGASFSIVHSGDVQCADVIWAGGATICGEDFSYKLQCAGVSPFSDLDDWTLTDVGVDNYCSHGLLTPVKPSSTTCSPLSIVFGPFAIANEDPPMPGEYCGCLPIPGSGTFTITVTE